ncbi:MAG: hypothetical protein ACKVJU_09710 [Verrucomicrobiales bacterium]
MNVRTTFFKTLFLSAIFATSHVLISGEGGESNKKTATEKLGRMNQPFATGLDMHTFNVDRGDTGGGVPGELLSLYDEFLELQGISQEGNQDDFNKLYALVKRDYELLEPLEKALDDRYDDLKDKYEELEEDIQDEKKDADLPKYLKLKAEAAPIKKKRNLYRTYLDSEKALLKIMEASKANQANARQREEACNTAIRVLYSLFSSQMLDEREEHMLPLVTRHIIDLVKQFIDRAERNSAPYLSPNHQHQRIGPFQSKNQAENLYNPANPSDYFTRREISKMSHAMVANLDVSPKNPMWHTREWMETKRPDTWSQIEKWVEDEVSEELLDKKKFKKKYPDFQYDLKTAQRVLFFDGVKRTATSPKIDVTDTFGQEWKLKWGEETATEPAGNRLRMLLGAKYCDLTYAQAGGVSHLLILGSELDRKMNPDKDVPLTTADFKKIMMDSTYEFNVTPFILGTGTITKENADSVLKHVPEEAAKKYQAKNLVGRTWIRFKESMVESKHDVIERGGPITIHTHASKIDRAMRQSLIIALWMEDTDAKEDNHRSAWVKDFAGVEGRQYVEFFHDPGSSLGGERRSGEINNLSAKRGTGEFMWVSPDARTILSAEFQIYRPAIWFGVAFTDHLAGAKHIVRIKKSEICKVVKHTEMPDFYQECMTWRLAKRRDIVAHFFGLPLPDSGAGDAPNVSFPLTTRSDRRHAANHYGIPLLEIEKGLVRTGYLPAENCGAATSDPFIDVLVEDGEIQSYEDTVLLGIIRDFRYPSGFVERIHREVDDEDWVSRRYKLKQQD